MYSLFINWIGSIPNVSDDIITLFVFISSLFILEFLLDFFRFIMYYITRR